MSTWQQILALPADYQQQIYNSIYNCSSQSSIPLSIRRCLAPWIECQDWSFYTDASVTFDECFFRRCYQLVYNFIEQLETLATTCASDALSTELNHCLAILQRSLNTADYDIIRQVDECLRAELAVIKQYQEALVVVQGNNSSDLKTTCSAIHLKIQYTESLLAQFEPYKGISSELYREVLLKQQEIIIMLETAINQLNQNLETWKTNQMTSTYSESYSEHYPFTEEAQSLAKSLVLLRKQLKRMENAVEGQLVVDCYSMKERVVSQLKSLINASFLIDQPPRQVIRTNLKLKRISVQSLVGNLFTGGQISTWPTVKVHLINEHQARQLYTSGPEEFPLGTNCGELSHSSAVMLPNSVNILSATFSRMQVKKVQRKAEKKKKSFESVTDEKLAFLFVASFVIDEELYIGVKVLSAPVVVIVNSYQEDRAHATILWDNAFAVPNRTSFDVPSEMPFTTLARILSAKFLKHACRMLSDDNIQCFAEKLLVNYSTDSQQGCVSFSQFARENLPRMCFTFWEWFNAALKLTNDYLRDLWYDGTIIGFISRHRTEELLLGQPAGTFLLRFSDTRLGGISIAVVTAEQSVMMVEPFSANDLKMRSLADRLRDFEQLQYLYPGTPKEVAFRRFYSPTSLGLPEVKDGYVLPMQLNFISNV